MYLLKLKTYTTYLFFIAMAFALSSCNDTRNLPVKTVEQQKDSITVWIGQAEDTISPLKEKLLKKAYDAVLELPEDSIKAKHLVNLSYAYVETTDTTTFRKVNKEAIALTKKIKDSSRLADAYWDLGDYFSELGYKQDSAYYYYREAQQLYKKINNDFSAARMLINMAIKQIEGKDYTGSEVTTIKAIELLKPLKKYRQLYNCYNNLGIIYSELEDYEKALGYYNDALTYLKKIDADRRNALELIILNNIGVVYKDQQKYDKAIEKYQEAQRKNNAYAKDPEFRASIINNIAYAKFKRGDTIGLPGMFYDALKIRDSMDLIPGIVINKLHLAEYYATYKDTANALKYAHETRELAMSSKNFRDLLVSLKLLSDLEVGEKSIIYLNQYIKVNDSLQKAERNLREKFTRIEFETDELILRNEQIEQISELQKWIIGVSFAALVFLTLSYIIFMQRNANERLKTETEIAMLKLSEKIKMEKVQQQERQRFSEELHDGILGKLFGTRMTLDTFNTKADKRAIDKRSQCIDKLQRIEEEIRSVSHELVRESFTDNDYVELVRSLLEEKSTIDKYEYMLDNDPAIQWKPVSDKIKLNLYRILQEALHNIHKYARAESVFVSYTEENGNLLMCISDDGVGFDMEGKKKPAGIGMNNMRSRISSLNGKITFDAKVGQGTTIDISVPLKRNEEPEKKKISFIKQLLHKLNIKSRKKEVAEKTEEPEKPEKPEKPEEPEELQKTA